MSFAPRSRRFKVGVIAAIAPIVVIVTGCGHPAARALEGRWFGDSVENFDPGDVALATGWARGASMEFSGSDLTVAIPAEDPRKGRFDVESAHDNDLVLAVRDEKGATTKARFALDGDRYLKWKLDERRTIVMRREQ
jgi:hypothetical protein